ncbi:kinase A anchor protein [Phlebopus sp. FC_14]|nr:kinase A anchor protein [Phlebopus sp. FC_14]
MSRNSSSAAKGRFRNGGPNNRSNSSGPPLTHCQCQFLSLKLNFTCLSKFIVLSLPIGHHSPLQESISRFTDGLLKSAPAVPGLDPSIAVAPRRLHLTLGVMSLVESVSPGDSLTEPPKTLSEALALLSSLGPRIKESLAENHLCVPLQRMDIMKPDRGDPDNAHVLWLGPSFDTEDALRLKAVGELVNQAFIEGGFILDRRPLKLHCTILNTTYRKPKSRGPRQPFSYKALLTSSATRGFLAEPSEPSDSRQPVKVDFGTWNVDEIQICKMGSYGPAGEYVSCGGFSLL